MSSAGILWLWLPVVVLVSGGCRDTAVIQQRGSTRDMFPDHESWESSIIISRNGRLMTVANSQRMIQYDNTDIAHLIGNVQVDFYNDEGLHVSRLLADSADVNTRTNTMSAFGHVIIRSDSGLVLRTRSLRWDNEYEMMTTQDSVMFATDNSDTLYGVGFESDVDLTHWKIYRPWGVVERGFGIQN